MQLRLISKLVPPMALSCIAACCVISCTSRPHTESDRQLRQKSAQTTEVVKQQSKEALANARVGAAIAERELNDIAAGVKDGMHGRSSPDASSSVDINSASVSELESLPGISAAKARQIVAHRPYRDAHQLVGRGLLTQSQYDAIAPHIAAD